MTPLYYASCLLYLVFGLFGFFFTFKEFADPWFSDTVSPGPGQLLLGDSGRMLMFEAGSDGVQSKVLGVPAWLLEGILLGTGSVALFSCWFTSQSMQWLTAYVAPIAGGYFLVNCVYLPLTGAPEMVVPMYVLGLPPFFISLWRVHCYLDAGADALRNYHAWLLALAAMCVGVCAWISSRADEYAAEIAILIRVREHFNNQNGMTWSAGLEYPDGFVLDPTAKRFLFF